MTSSGTAQTVRQVVPASSLGVLCWDGGARGPRVRGVVGLLRQGRPAVAFTYAEEEVARAVAGASTAALALVEQRGTARGFRPTVLSGRPELVEDVTGEIFAEELLSQELRRYPPSRLLADSPILMREHWWYLPRLIVELEVDEVVPLPSGGGEHLLVPTDLDVRRVDVRNAQGSLEPGERWPDLHSSSPVRPGPAVVFGQDASFPDLEQWSQWSWRGTWDGAGLRVEEVPAQVGLAGPPGLLHRWRRQRRLERACVAGIRAAQSDHRGSPRT